MNTEMTEVQMIETGKATNGVGPTGIPKVEENLTLTNDTFAEDMAKLEAEAKAKAEPVTTEPPTMPEQPVEQAPVTPEATKTEVPEKFKTPDGKIDEAKLEKSLVNAEETLAKYLTLEKQLKQKINEVKAKDNAYLNPPANVAEVKQPVNGNFAKQIEEDIAREGVGPVLTKLFTAAQEAAYEKARTEIDGLKNISAEATTKQQIETIAKKDPWVYTQEGLNTLTNILDNQPYLWQANDPYKAAYLIHKGMSVASQPSSQVLTPNPTARPSAPVPTGQAANPVNTAPSVRLDSKDAIESHLKKLTPAQQSEFFKKMGFPSF